MGKTMLNALIVMIHLLHLYQNKHHHPRQLNNQGRVYMVFKGYTFLLFA
jgi:hypothetical protein